VFHGNIHRHLMTFSLANWAVAIVSWSISAYLGSAVPTGAFVYAVLFVIGLFAVVVAIGSFLLAVFGTEPAPAEAIAAAAVGGVPAAESKAPEGSSVPEKPAARDKAPSAKPDDPARPAEPARPAAAEAEKPEAPAHDAPGDAGRGS
jgi:hypothetical protein